MPLDPQKPVQQSKIPAETVLFEAGQSAQMLCLIHQGEVGIVSKNSGSKSRIYSLGANSTPGFASLILEEPYPFRIKANTECVISAFPVRGNFQNLILGKLNVGMLAARSLMQEIIASHGMIKKNTELLGLAQKIADNFSIAYFRCNPNAFQDNQAAASGDAIDPVMSSARFLLAEFQQNGGVIPEPMTQAWLEQDHSGIFHKDYDYESDFDTDEFNFLRRLLSLSPDMQGNIFKSDINILHFMCKKLSRFLYDTIGEIYQLQESVNLSLESLCSGDYCYVEKFALLSDLLDSGFTSVPATEFVTVLGTLSRNIGNLLNSYQTLQGAPFKDINPSVNKVKSFLASRPEAQKAAEEKSAPVRAGVDVQAAKKELAGSMGKIMNFSGISQEEAKKCMADMKSLKVLQNPLDSAPELRKLRRQIARTYWAAYEKSFLKYRESGGNVPLPVSLMLHYGFFDEEFLADEHIVSIYDLKDTSRAKSGFSIIRSIDWLGLVGDKKEPPSVDEMGLTYFEKLKHEHKDKGWKRESDVPEEFDNVQNRIKYEIQNFMETNVRLTSGSPATAFPILTKYQISIPLEKCFVTMGRLSEVVEKIMSLDYSAFHREVLINDEKAGILKEFVQVQVIPNFILVPSIGTKVMMWQDFSGRNKNSTGRIAVPVFATADLYTLALEAVGAFRWELIKTIMGPDWNNVSIPSITADYTDYVQFYKKNRELSPEIKEKLAGEFKRFRTDRDRFVNDYINWIKYESEGVLKLNKVARSIMYRHIPFAKEIRDKLATQPAYTDLHNRFTNIRNRKLKEIEVKYRKYGEEHNMPDLLRKNLEFYKV